jgi:glycosyltransferase involved in cell wall biosynthesis
METRAPARMLLLFTGVFANGGIQRFNQTLLTALSSLDVKCDVLSIHDTSDTIAQNASRQNIRIRGFRGSRSKFSDAALRAILSRRYDWIVIGHVNLLVFAMAALSLKPFSGSRTVMIAHGIEVWWDIARLRRLALSRVHRILCVSHYTRQRIIAQVPGIRAERVLIFPNALGSNWSELTPAPSAIAPNMPFILSVTRLERGDRYKGIVTVIEALSQMGNSSTQYIVVGQGNDLGFLQGVAVRFGVADRVHFLRGISDVDLIHLYSRCDAFVLPSGKEGFGIVFLEAMYFGAPVIAASEKGALDVIRDGETGLLVRFGDSIALKKAIERLRDDAALRERLRERGRATVIGDGEFTFRRFSIRTADIFSPTRQHAA